MTYKPEAWDAFISHAGEDKDEVARPLAERLKRLGMGVWYDEAELKIGDSLSGSIDHGLSRSGKGIVILSRAFFAKFGPDYELRGLIARSVGRERVILPIWHNVRQDDVASFSPTLADTFAETTAQPLDQLALKLVDTIRPDLGRAIHRRIAAHRMRANAPIRDIPLANIAFAGVRHRVLPIDLERRIRLVRQALLEVFPSTLEDWIMDFRRDARPSDEVAVWENIASRYCDAIEQVELSIAERHEIFAFLLLASTGANDPAVAALLKLNEPKREAVLEAIGQDNAIPQNDGDEPATLDQPSLLNRETFDPSYQIDDSYLRELAGSAAQSNQTNARAG